MWEPIMCTNFNDEYYLHLSDHQLTSMQPKNGVKIIQNLKGKWLNAWENHKRIYVRCLNSVWIKIKQIEDKPAQPLPSQTKFIQAAFSLLLYYYDVKINVKHGKVKMKMNANMYVYLIYSWIDRTLLAELLWTFFSRDTFKGCDLKLVS